MMSGKVHGQKYTVLLDMPIELKQIPVVYPENSDSTTVLRMAYAESRIKNPEDWNMSLAQTRQVYRIEVVYTQYPFDTTNWVTRYGKLMPARLEAIFTLDPSLKDPNLKWNFVAQTNCRTSWQAQNYFHGVVLYHTPRHIPNEMPNENIFVSKLPNAQDTVISQSEIVTISPRKRDTLPHLEPVPDPRTKAMRELEAAEAKRQDQDELRKQRYSEIYQAEEADNMSEYGRMVHREMGIVKGILSGELPLEDSSVFRILDRHPEWSDLAVVMDWTGSMYPYGAQLVRWHQLNLSKGVVKHLAVFNDGDDRRRNDIMPNKPIGHTGGVYFLEPDNLESIIALMETVMLNGDGGDLPENDLEAVLSAAKEYPSAGKLLLISDGNSRVRDMALLSYLNVPVIIIPCGLKQQEIHPDYLTMAWHTGGSVLLEGDELHFKEPRQELRRNQIKFSRVRYELNPLTNQFFVSERQRALSWPLH